MNSDLLAWLLLFLLLLGVNIHAPNQPGPAGPAAAAAAADVAVDLAAAVDAAVATGALIFGSLLDAVSGMLGAALEVPAVYHPGERDI
jgi:hypothetical protein